MRRNDSLKATRVVVFSNSFLGGLIEQVGTTGVEKVLIKSSATPGGLLQAVREVLEGPIHPHRKPPQTAAPSLNEVPVASSSSASAPIQPAALESSSTPGATLAPAGPALVAERVPSPDRDRMRADFRKAGGVALAGLRELCRSFIEAPDLAGQTTRVADLHRKAGFLTQMAAAAEYGRFARLADALETLTFELQERPRLINDSSLNTVASTVALLGDLLEQLDDQEVPPPALQPKVLVVDNDAVSNRALIFSLSRIQLRAVSVTDPLEALQKLQAEPFDLVLLDINMPDLDGLALCEKLRAIPHHRWTPVVFVTSATDVKTRARSFLSGGNDFVTKPVLPVELCVKAVTHLIRQSSAKSGLSSRERPLTDDS